MVVFFQLLRNLHAAFYCGCTKLHSQQRCRKVPLSPPHRPHLLLLVSLIVSHLDRCEVVSHYEWCWAHFHVPVAICLSSLKCLFRFSAHFLIKLFGFLILTWGITLSEISQKEKKETNTVWFHLYMESKKQSRIQKKTITKNTKKSLSRKNRCF